MNVYFPSNNAPIRLYRDPLSDHCYRVELMMHVLDLPYETIDVDIANGAHRAAKFLEISPFGQVPAIVDNGITLSDSNAILTYLEKKYNQGYEWSPKDPVRAAEVQQWLSVAAGADPEYDTEKKKSESVLDVLEPMLAERKFLAGDEITLADIAGYSYISHVPKREGSLKSFPAINAWLERVEAQPRFRRKARTPVMEAS